ARCESLEPVSPLGTTMPPPLEPCVGGRRQTLELRPTDATSPGGGHMPEFDAPEPVGGGSAETAQVGNMLGNLNPLDSKQMAHAENQSSQLLESAKGGGFRVSENAAKPIRDALIAAYDDVLGILKEARVLAAEPQLGTGPYAQQ